MGWAVTRVPALSIALFIHGSTGQLRRQSQSLLTCPAVPWTQKAELGDKSESMPAWTLEQDPVTQKEEKDKEGKEKKGGARGGENKEEQRGKRGKRTGRELLSGSLASYPFSQKKGEAWG